MNWKQIVFPNLDPVITQPDGKGGTYALTDWLGWCLAYVQFAYSANYAGSPARVSWESYTKWRHTNKNIPVEVLVPLWFSGYQNLWHVLIAQFNKDGSGTAWTSPNTNKAQADVIKFTSLDDLVAKLKRGWSYDIEYVGWSEDVGGTRVIESKEDEMELTLEQVDKVLKMGLQEEPSPAALNDKNYQRDAGLLIDTVWNNGGKQIYQAKMKRKPYGSPQVDKVIKMGLRRVPTAKELADKNYLSDPSLLIDTVWNNGGKQSYENSSVPDEVIINGITYTKKKG